MVSSPLIPRRVLFDNPTYLGPQLSPDGRFISWIAPVDGVLNIWVAPIGDIAHAEPVTRTKGRPIYGHHWSADSRKIIFTNDENGDERSHIFVVDPATKSLRDITPFSGVTAQIGMVSQDRQREIAVGLNDRDERWHDTYTIDLETGVRTLVWENTQNALGITLDWTFQPRVLSQNTPDGGKRYCRIGPDKAITPWFDVSFEDNWLTWLGLPNRSNERVFLMSTTGRDKAAFSWRDLTTGRDTLIAANDRADCIHVVMHPTTYEVQAAAAAAERLEWFFATPEAAPAFARLKVQLPGADITVDSQTDDDRRWIVTANSPTAPIAYHLFDRDRDTVTELFPMRPALKSYRLAPMCPVIIRSRDGLDLVSYLTLPKTVASTKPVKPLPMVLVVHGGPWARDTYGYRNDHQWLADRGYAVLSVNYRGSTGFGKAFVAASEKEHGRKMHFDLIDAVQWAIGEGIADADKVAIFGASYGGLASFLAATFTPDVFCCAVPVVGITNLQTLLENMPPYWAGFAEYMYRSYGDPRTEDGRKLLAERSPIHKVDRITKPMLIFHGANDVRCKVAESDSIAAAMQARSIPVTYVVYPDEGHGFDKPANRLSYIAIAEAFFARHLGGACEPVGTDLDGSSHEVRAGEI